MSDAWNGAWGVSWGVAWGSTTPPPAGPQDFDDPKGLGDFQVEAGAAATGFNTE